MRIYEPGQPATPTAAQQFRVCPHAGNPGNAVPARSHGQGGGCIGAARRRRRLEASEGEARMAPRRRRSAGGQAAALATGSMRS